MLSPDLPRPLDPADGQAFSAMKARSNSVSTSNLSQKPLVFNDTLGAQTVEEMQQVLQQSLSEAMQIDIPIREPRIEPLKRQLRFDDLPVEVHEAILDHIFGIRASTTSTSAPGKSSAVRGWSSILRHPRRKALSDLALVSPTWRPLVQERLFRHIKVRGTQNGLVEVYEFFRAREHFLPYVKHVEVWIPVWGNRALPSSIAQPQSHAQDPNRAVVTTLDGGSPRFEETNTINVVYSLASHNASLEEIFTMAKIFSHARILTLEGGHCKKPPMVQHFRIRKGHIRSLDLPTNPNITTLVIRGAWNIMRDINHYCDVVRAFPNVREWHCSYAKPKLEANSTIHSALAMLPRHLTHLNITIDGFYNKITTPGLSHSPNITMQDIHLCSQLGKIAPTLEALSFTGKVCASFFLSMKRAAGFSAPRLRLLDLNIKNCCRMITVKNNCPLNNEPPAISFHHHPQNQQNPMLGHFTDHASSSLNPLHPASITNFAFIQAFEQLVHSSIVALPALATLNFVRIRFIDLDSACPLLNPYFQLKGTECTGLWSDKILTALNENRPECSFVELADGIEFGKAGSSPDNEPNWSANHGNGDMGNDGMDGDEGLTVLWPRSRPLSMRAGAYRGLGEGLKG